MSRERILYPTLTRPILIKGVPRDWAILSGFVGPFAFMMSAQFLEALWPLIFGFGTFGVMWVTGYLLAKYWDSEFLSVLVQKRIRIGRTTGPGRYNGNRYWG